MGMFRNVVATVAGMAVSSVSVWHAADALGEAFYQPGQPSQQPGPKNPSPRPSNPSPGPSNPSPRPERQNPQPRPDRQNPMPDRSNPIPDQNDPGEPGRQPDPANKEAFRQQNRTQRAFAFQSPDMEGRFNIATRRLIQMEQRMQRSHETLLRKLGEARQLSGERQNGALFDVIQQLLKDQADMQRYLVQSRTIWTGDMDLGDENELIDENDRGDEIGRPDGRPIER